MGLRRGCASPERFGQDHLNGLSSWAAVSSCPLPFWGQAGWFQELVLLGWLNREPDSYGGVSTQKASRLR